MGYIGHSACGFYYLLRTYNDRRHTSAASIVWARSAICSVLLVPRRAVYPKLDPWTVLGIDNINSSNFCCTK